MSKVNILGKNKTPSTLLTVTDSTQSPVTVGSVIKKINSSKRTTAVKITGNALANTISGGKGNDYLSGGSGKDTLSSGDGKDVIFGFEDSDTLTLDNLAFTSSCKNNVVSITFNDDGSIIDFTASTFHVNDDVYKISGSKLVKK